MHDSYTRTLDAAAASRLRGMSLLDLIAALIAGASRWNVNHARGKDHGHCN